MVHNTSMTIAHKPTKKEKKELLGILERLQQSAQRNLNPRTEPEKQEPELDPAQLPASFFNFFELQQEEQVAH